MLLPCSPNISTTPALQNLKIQTPAYFWPSSWNSDYTFLTSSLMSLHSKPHKHECTLVHTHTHTHTNSKKHSSHDLPCILWNMKVHYHLQIGLPLVPTLSQTNPVNIFPAHFFKMHHNIIFPPTPRTSNGILPSCFPSKTLYMFPLLFHSCHVLQPFHFPWPDHRLIVGMEYRSCTYSIFTSALLGPNIFCSTVFINTLSPYWSLTVTAQVPHPFKTTAKLKFCVF